MKKDLDLLMNIWLDTNIKAHCFISKDYWLSQFDNVKNTLNNAIVYIYEDENCLKGFLGLLPSSHIAGLFVKEVYQRQSIGYQLLRKAQQKNSSLTLAVYKKYSST
ncbi:GNAT family N-acetyltransferase [endosymbiont 'TC1' of Trimyema compressum]|uniref:GNAT family N-acetyltransferase n=1 Tax=endosymbiont 'TC1' of Trimyema compressum TaxID=243899 RepID=UPI000B4D66EF|nr:GNAT family N-acetyltransferase [endosymbiont 'TC1' of Trimyema compressum]